LSDIAKLFVVIGAKVDDFNKATQNVSKKIQGFGKSLQSVGKDLTTGITLPIVAVGTAAMKMGMDFEESMSKVVGLVGVAQDQVDEWSKDLLALGPALGKTPKELADGLFFVTSAGFRGAEALNILEMSAKGSAAGLGETQVVADLVTSAINAYGLENLDAAQATDILVTAVREGKAEAPELAAALGQVLPIASEMGVTFDQVGAAAAAMTRTGTDASTASMQLKNILMGLLKPSSQAEKALSAMGTSSAELRSQIQEEGLLAALQNIRGLTNQYGEDIMATVFPNIRSLLGVLDLMGANAEENAAIFEALADSTGALDHAFETASNTAKFKWNQTTAELSASLITLFESLKEVAIPIMEKFAEAISKVTSWFSNLDDRSKKIILIVAAIAAAIGPVLVVLGTLVVAIGALISPIGLVVAAVVALIAIVALIIANWDKIADFFVGLWDTVKQAFSAAWEWIKNMFFNYTPAGLIIQHWDKIKGFFVDLWDTVKEIFSNALDSIVTFFVSTWNGIKEFLVNLWSTVKEIFFNALESIATFFTELPGKISKFFTELPYMLGFALGTFIRWTIDMAVAAYQWGKDFIAAAGEWLAALPGRIWDALTLAATKLAEWAVIAWEWANTTWQNIVDTIVEFVLELPGRIWDALTLAATKLAEWTVLAWEWAKTTGVEMVANFITFIAELPGKLWEWLVQTIQKFMEWDQQVKENAKTAGSNLVEGFIEFITDLPSKLWDILLLCVEKISDIGSAFWDAIKGAASNLWEGFKAGLGISSPSYIEEALLGIGENSIELISEAFNRVRDFLIGIWEDIKGVFVDALAGVGSFIVDSFNAYLTFLGTFKENILDLFVKVKDGILNIWDKVVSGIKGHINKIIDAVNGMITRLNRVRFSVPDWVPVIGGKSWGFRISKIPRLEFGGEIMRAGMAIVGERGPELLNLPRGATVRPLDNRNYSRTSTVQVTQNFYDRQATPAEYRRQTEKALRTFGEFGFEGGAI